MMVNCFVIFLLTILLSVECLFAGDSCVAGDAVGRCQLLSNCRPLLEEIRNAGTPMPSHMRRKLQSLACGFQTDHPVVCCVNNEVDDSKTSTEKHNSFDIDPDTNKNDDQIHNNIDETPPDVRNHPNLKLLPTCCGGIESDRIIGGNRTRLYEMPWMALISYDSGRGTKLSCGGTIINERYVLTAAHCVTFLGKRLTLSSVLIGEWDIRQDPDCERLQGELQCAPSVWNVTIESVVPHPGYTPQTLFDDIALVRLSRKLDFALDNIKPICLPTTPELQAESLVGVQGVVAGWGATEDGLQSPVLLRVELPIVSNEECQAAYKGNPHIYSRQMCAGGIEDRDSCGGDSGGPLMYPGRTPNGILYVQRGIVSYGSKRCGIGGFPGVYTRISYYMDWILDNMRP